MEAFREARWCDRAGDWSPGFLNPKPIHTAFCTPVVFSKCGTQASTSELIRNANSRPQSRPTESEAVRWSPVLCESALQGTRSCLGVRPVVLYWVAPHPGLPSPLSPSWNWQADLGPSHGPLLNHGLFTPAPWGRVHGRERIAPAPGPCLLVSLSRNLWGFRVVHPKPRSSFPTSHMPFPSLLCLDVSFPFSPTYSDRKPKSLCDAEALFRSSFIGALEQGPLRFPPLPALYPHPRLPLSLPCEWLGEWFLYRAVPEPTNQIEKMLVLWSSPPPQPFMLLLWPLLWIVIICVLVSRDGTVRAWDRFPEAIQ